MEKVTIEEVADSMGPAAVKRRLTRELGAEHLAINYYELTPGDSFAFGYHAHPEQEELFHIQAGTVTFETESEPIEVAAGETIRFAPREYQRGYNRGEERVVALAIGAPQESGGTDIRRACPDCGERTSQTIETVGDREALVTICEDCGAETGRFT